MADRRTHRPVRMCIGCRERSEPGHLLRVVAQAGSVIPDPTGHLPGRGAWLHVGCLGEAEKRRAFGRALRIPGLVDVKPLHDWVAGH